jgi:hypothetical protein
MQLQIFYTFTQHKKRKKKKACARDKKFVTGKNVCFVKFLLGAEIFRQHPSSDNERPEAGKLLFHLLFTSLERMLASVSCIN